MVRSHGTSWRVLVRAASEDDARANVEARGHEVVSVEPGVRPPRREWNRPTVCPVCEYALQGIRPGEHGLIQCPECGMVATPPDDTILGIARQRFGRRGQPVAAPWGCIVASMVAIGMVAAALIFTRLY